MKNWEFNLSKQSRKELIEPFGYTKSVSIEA